MSIDGIEGGESTSEEVAVGAAINAIDDEKRAADAEEESVRREIVVRDPIPLPLTPREMTVDEMVAQVALIDEVSDKVMVEDVHFGVIPGTGKKPTLLKPGAEKLGVLFRLGPRFEIEEKDLQGGHLAVTVCCTLYHIPTGNLVGQGYGSCSTMETKYAYRQAQRECPECGVEAIIKGREEYGGGWLCFKRKGGCGAKFADASEEGQTFETTEVGRKVRPPEELADFYNTVLKMGVKRAHVAAILLATGASDRFTPSCARSSAPSNSSGD